MRTTIRLPLAPSAVAAVLAVLAAGAVGAQTRRPTMTQPVVCGGNQEIRLVDYRLSTDGDAITASGNCEVYLARSVVQAGGTAVRAINNAEVHIHDSEISGVDAALSASNLAQIHFQNSEIRGRLRSSNLAELVDRGGNRLYDSGGGVPVGEGAGADEPEGTVQVGGIEVGPGGVRIGGTDVVRIDEEGVSVAEGAVVVDPEGVSVGGDAVRVDERGVRVGGEGVVIVDDGSVVVADAGDVVVVDEHGNVRVDSADGTIVVTGDWREEGSLHSDTDRVLVELGARSEDDRLRIDLAGDILFDFDSAAIRAEAAVTLSKVAHVIRRRATGRVTVIGHTDSIGSAEYNQKLSEQRAVSVMRWLNRAEGIPLRLMTGIGAGSSRPIAHNTLPDGGDDPVGRQRNRRVEIQILTDR